MIKGCLTESEIIEMQLKGRFIREEEMERRINLLIEKVRHKGYVDIIIKTLEG